MHFATMAQNCNLQAHMMLSFLDFSHFSNNRISLYVLARFDYLDISNFADAPQTG